MAQRLCIYLRERTHVATGLKLMQIEPSRQETLESKRCRQAPSMCAARLKHSLCSISILRTTLKSTARTHRLRVFPYCCATRSELVLGMFSRRAVRWRLRGFRARPLVPETISLTSYLRDNGFSSFG